MGGTATTDMNGQATLVYSSDDAGTDMRDLRGLIGQVAAAAWQVGEAGTAAQAAEARRILADTRRALYRILAEDDDEPESTPEA